MKTLKNQNGVALVIVIIAMAVTAIMGSAVLTLMVSDTNFAKNQEETLQAEYIARAGADAAGKYVQDNPANFQTKTFIETLGEGSFSATISKPASDTVLISSVGTVNGISKTVNLHLIKQGAIDVFNGIRQTAENAQLDLSKLHIYHFPEDVVNIEANVTYPDWNIQLSWENTYDPNITKSTNAETPSALLLPSNYETNLVRQEDITYYTFWGIVTLIQGDAYLTTLKKDNRKTIIFDTQGKDQTVVVDKLDFSGPQTDVEIIGGGRVHLYIIDSGSIDTPMNMNFSSPSKLFMYVNDGATLSLQANCQISAYIYAPNATIEMQSAATSISGAVVGNLLCKKNDRQGPMGKFYYIPLPDDMDFESSVTYNKDYYSN
ncbi:MAG: hypothetical protein AB7D36_10335 [Oscillospiraceae bacterium]